MLELIKLGLTSETFFNILNVDALCAQELVCRLVQGERDLSSLQTREVVVEEMIPTQLWN